MEDRKLEKLNKMFELMAQDTITPKEIEKFLEFVLDFIKQSKEQFDLISKENLRRIDVAMNHLQSFAEGEFESKIQEIKDIVATRPRDGIDGKDGISPDITTVAAEASAMTVAELLPLMPTIDEIEVDLPKLGPKIRDGLELLKDDERLDVSAIKGIGKRLASFGSDLLNRAIGILDQRTSFLINKVSNIQDQVNRINVTSGGQVNSVVGGTGISVDSTDPANPIVSATGSGVTVETPTGTVNSVNATFTVSAQPKWVVSDGVNYFDGAGYSYAALSITLDIPPSQFIRAIT